MAYYLIKDEDAESVNIAVLQAEDNDALVLKLISLGVSTRAFISHIETLAFDQQGVCMIYAKEFEVSDGNT